MPDDELQLALALIASVEEAEKGDRKFGLNQHMNRGEEGEHNLHESIVSVS